MIEYRITKYNPQNRVNGEYQVHEWTSISDIGKLFDGVVLTYNQYIKIEEAYIDCCIELLQKSNVSELAVCNPEYYDDKIVFPKLLHTESDIRKVIMCCLREKCWVKLETSSFFIHFGYDYYMYISTDLPCSLVEETAKKHSLFCEVSSSPYSNRRSNDV